MNANAWMPDQEQDGRISEAEEPIVKPYAFSLNPQTEWSARLFTATISSLLLLGWRGAIQGRDEAVNILKNTTTKMTKKEVIDRATWNTQRSMLNSMLRKAAPITAVVGLYSGIDIYSGEYRQKFDFWNPFGAGTITGFLIGPVFKNGLRGIFYSTVLGSMFGGIMGSIVLAINTPLLREAMLRDNEKRKQLDEKIDELQRAKLERSEQFRKLREAEEDEIKRLEKRDR
ncbi:hypothetical protein PROFUN_12084 [Planoprotostelium fungivorum]|uniref:Uncharacterized protein n=1 Tax=Planoprotostelium fungivorum TaxID=1890364 RepID=A0A2P6N8R8_9EUKA|nr:hypothetical protein PROFUN_12084 [Planoprotostelium fungivorum]